MAGDSAAAVWWSNGSLRVVPYVADGKEVWMNRLRSVLVIFLATLIAACSGDGDVSPPDTEVSATGEESGDELADNCSLITPEEATIFAGYDLELGENSILGCGYLPPDSSVADIVVNSAVLDGDAASVAGEAFPDATEIIPVGVGDDTVAVTTPSGDTIASTRDGRRFVELAIVFIGIDPDETARIEEAAQLAVTALERWDG